MPTGYRQWWTNYPIKSLIGTKIKRERVLPREDRHVPSIPFVVVLTGQNTPWSTLIIHVEENAETQTFVH